VPTPIYKLHPHRTIHLQGFSDFGAVAAIHHASDAGFTASGVFRDAPPSHPAHNGTQSCALPSASSAPILEQPDRDDFFGHPRFSHLPGSPAVALRRRPAIVAAGKDLPAIPADTPVTIDALGVGSTFPGRRLVVRVRF
jgi:hypothetical protein